jgi:hypothetical protein
VIAKIWEYYLRKTRDYTKKRQPSQRHFDMKVEISSGLHEYRWGRQFAQAFLPVAPRIPEPQPTAQNYGSWQIFCVVESFCCDPPKLRLHVLSKIRIPVLKIFALATVKVAIYLLDYEFFSTRSSAVLGLPRH